MNGRLGKTREEKRGEVSEREGRGGDRNEVIKVDTGSKEDIGREVEIKRGG